MNGVVEVANKNLKKIITKMVVTYKDWNEMLLYALHAYHTIVRAFTSATLYSFLFLFFIKCKKYYRSKVTKLENQRIRIYKYVQNREITQREQTPLNKL
jgi:hypothetical protein